MEKFSISSPRYERGLVATTVPSALPRIGEVNTSSEGMLGLNSTPPIVFSEPPRNIASGISPTLKSVPFEEWYLSSVAPRELM